MPTKTAEFEPGHGFSKEDWDAVSDNPELTKADFKKAKPFAEMFPDMARGRGRPKSDAPKKQITLRLSPDVVEHFKAGGPGWQSRIDETLRKAVGIK